MKKEVEIIIAEDDIGHADLITRNLRRVGVSNNIIHFKDGEETLNFLFKKSKGPHRKAQVPYILLLDIRMPKVDGVEVLRKVKEDSDLKKIPVFMITTTDDPREVEKCHELGCSNYFTKSVDNDNFVEAIKRIGLFLLVAEIPKLN